MLTVLGIGVAATIVAGISIIIATLKGPFGSIGPAREAYESHAPLGGPSLASVPVLSIVIRW